MCVSASFSSSSLSGFVGPLHLKILRDFRYQNSSTVCRSIPLFPCSEILRGIYKGPNTTWRCVRMFEKRGLRYLGKFGKAGFEKEILGNVMKNIWILCKYNHFSMRNFS